MSAKDDKIKLLLNKKRLTTKELKIIHKKINDVKYKKLILDRIRKSPKEEKKTYTLFSSKLVIGDPSNFSLIPSEYYDSKHIYSGLNGTWIGYKQYFFNEYNADITVIGHKSYINKDIKMVPGKGSIWTDVSSYYVGDLLTHPKYESQYEKIVLDKIMKNGYLVETGYDGSIKYYVGYERGKVVKVIFYNYK